MWSLHRDWSTNGRQSVVQICSQRAFSSPIVNRSQVRVPFHIVVRQFPDISGNPEAVRDSVRL